MMERATSKGVSAAHWLLWTPQRGQIELAECHYPAAGFDRFRCPGTTTDPVEKPMELLPIGPVLFVDTAGVDDVGALGAQRIEKTRQAIARSDIGVLVTEAGVWSEFEEKLLAELRSHGIPVAGGLEQGGSCSAPIEHDSRFEQENLPYVKLSQPPAKAWINSAQLLGDRAGGRRASHCCAIWLVRGNCGAGDAHRQGSSQRPHQATAGAGHSRSSRRRIFLRGGERCGARENARQLKTPPSLLLQTRQVFDQVARITPDSIPLTAFSILLSRLKGDLVAQTRAALTIDSSCVPATKY
jgi:hypothetical protein